MRSELHADRTTLGRALLTAYEDALLQCLPQVAEHVLCAMEELARAEPAYRPMLDRAYLLIGRPSRPTA